jgi:serine protease Do
MRSPPRTPLAHGRALLAALALAFAPSLAAAAPTPAEKAPEKATLPRAATRPAPQGVADLKAIQKQVKAVVAKVLPATVGLRVGAASGSGVIVSEDGYVLTAGHVSGKHDREVTVILHDGRKVKGKTLGGNGRIDSGMIKITDKGKWPHVALGDSSNLKRGQWVVATGHPRGYIAGRTPVVRLGRVLNANSRAIVTDCTLVGGDSGGPLFDLTGKVVGIHSRIGLPITANVHVPVDTYRETWDRLVKGEIWGMGPFGFGGRANTAYLGVTVAEDAKDCKIEEVTPDSPAAKAGLKPGDVITKFDGQKVRDFDQLGDLIAKKKPKEKVKIELLRDKETMTIEVTLSTRPRP